MVRPAQNRKIIHIDAADASDRWVPIPNRSAGTYRLKGLYRKKGNCYFSKGIPISIFRFAFRSVVKLGLRDKTIIFSRGAVKKRGISRKDMVSITELEWDVGISIIIPQKLACTKKVIVFAGAHRYPLVLMELILLAGLIRIAMPMKASPWYYAKASAVLTGGWKKFDDENPDIDVKLDQPRQ